jgi:two-component system LytT family sensor kinase
MRFSDRLRTSIDVPDSALECAIPQLLLQPLVENVIKHAVSRTSQMVSLSLRAEEKDGELFIYIEDDGPSATMGSMPGSGMGLRNLRDRLQHLFGGKASLETVFSTDKKRAIVRLPRCVLSPEAAL